MAELYVDDWVKEAYGFESTEEYLRHCKENNFYPLLKGYEYFKSFLENEIIEPCITIIRTYYTRGGMDEFFGVTLDRRLEGLEAPAHGGRTGIHEPEKILSLENSPDDWFLEDFWKIDEEL